MRTLCALAALAALSISQASLGGPDYLLYENGPWITTQPTNTPTIGAIRGFSLRSPAPATSLTGFGDFGWPVNFLLNGTFDSAADDFNSAHAWKISRIRVFVYESGATTTNATIVGGYLRIWREKPTGPRLTDNADARIFAGAIGTGPDTSDMLTPIPQVVEDPLSSDPLAPGAGRSVWTGVYRISFPGDTAVSRPVMAMDFAARQLAGMPVIVGPSTYWLEVSLVGSTTGIEAWVPTETQRGERGVEITGGNYVNAVGTGVGRPDVLGRPNIRPNIDFAFEIYGIKVGDANADGSVSIDDFLALAAAYETILGDPNYDATVDFDEDSDVDIDDFLTLSGAYEG